MIKNSKDKLIKKRVFNSLYAKDSIVEYLNEQASKGYMLEKAVGTSYYFRKSEPRKVKYAAHIFSKASMYDTIPAKTTAEFIEYCEAAGWKYICANGKIQYFYTEDEEVTPIETDAKEELKILNKYAFAPTIIILLLYPIITILSNIVLAIVSEYESSVDIFISYNPIYNIMYIGIGMLWLHELIKFIIYNVKNKKSISNGEGLVYFGKKTDRCNLILTYAIGIGILVAYVLYGILDSRVSIGISLLIVIIITICIASVMLIKKYSKLSRTGNVILNICVVVVTSGLIMVGVVGFVIYHLYTDTPVQKNEKRVEYYDEELESKEVAIIRTDKLPISGKELGFLDKECKFIDSWCDKYKTIFGSFYKCEEIQYNKNMEQIGCMLDYEVLKTDVEFIKKSYINKFLDSSDRTIETKASKEQAKKWKADKVYLLDYTTKDGLYNGQLIVYDDMVIYIDCAGEDYIQENINMIYEKLADL